LANICKHFLISKHLTLWREQDLFAIFALPDDSKATTTTRAWITSFAACRALAADSLAADSLAADSRLLTHQLLTH